jgi:ribosomal-protein-alanine N-acetyltransferase
MEFQPQVLSREESDYFAVSIEAHFGKHGFCLYAAELRLEQQFIGFVGIHVPTFEAAFTPCIEIGWRLAAEVWGRGLATEGGLAVLRHAFTVLGVPEVVSFTAAINTRAQRVMQKLGMNYDPTRDFEHPRLPDGHRLRRHVLYRIGRGAFLS